MPPPESPETDRPTTALALAVGIPAILILAGLPFLQVGDGTSISKLFLFLGRFHPTLLHLPVALLLLALLLEMIRLPRLRGLVPSFPSTVLDFVVWLAALSAFAAALAGWLLAHEGGYQTVYGHLRRIRVALNQRVRSGMIIGEVGSTGRSTGAHLHFEVRRKGSSRDPLPLLPPVKNQ
jgi:hypothetical protein